MRTYTAHSRQCETFEGDRRADGSSNKFLYRLAFESNFDTAKDRFASQLKVSQFFRKPKGEH